MQETSNHGENASKSAAYTNITRVVAVASFMISIIVAISSVSQTLIYRSQLELGRDQERKQLRAYIGTENVSIDQYQKPNFRIVIGLKNFGNSLASSIQSRINTDATIEPQGDIFTFREIDYWKNEGGNLDFQGDVHNTTIETSFSPSDLDTLSRQNGVIVTYGVVEYNDIFDDIHHLGFCLYFRYGDYTKAFTKTFQPIYGTFCANGNYSD